jgi:hypothetical protein
LNNHSTRKQIDELAERLAGWSVKKRDVSIEFENEAERLSVAKLRDPRTRYYEQKKEDWLHDTNFNENCDCEECKLNRVEPEDCHYCNNGCGGDEGCIPSCKYYPQEGLQTLEGQIAHKGTTEYDRLLQEWRDYYCRRVNARKRFKR